MASPSGMNRAMLRLMSLIHSRSASDASLVRDRSHVPNSDGSRPRRRWIGVRVATRMTATENASSQPRHGDVRRARAIGRAQRRVTGRARAIPGQNRVTPFIGRGWRAFLAGVPRCAAQVFRRRVATRPSAPEAGASHARTDLRHVKPSARPLMARLSTPRSRASPRNVSGLNQWRSRLGRVRRDQQVRLLPGGPFRDVDVEVRAAELAVELGHLELEDEVVPERLPGQLADEPVVLVEVVAVVGQDQVRPHRALDRFEQLLERRPGVRKVTVAERLDPNVDARHAFAGTRGPRSGPRPRARPTR